MQRKFTAKTMKRNQADNDLETYAKLILKCMNKQAMGKFYFSDK